MQAPCPSLSVPPLLAADISGQRECPGQHRERGHQPLPAPGPDGVLGPCSGAGPGVAPVGLPSLLRFPAPAASGCGEALIPSRCGPIPAATSGWRQGGAEGTGCSRARLSGVALGDRAMGGRGLRGGRCAHQVPGAVCHPRALSLGHARSPRTQGGFVSPPAPGPPAGCSRDMAVGTLSCARSQGHTWARGQRCHLAALVLLQGGKGERGLPGSYGSKGEKGDRVSVPSRAPPAQGCSGPWGPHCPA